MSKKTISLDLEVVDGLIAKTEDVENLTVRIELAVTVIRDVVAAIRGTDYLESFRDLKKLAYDARIASYQIRGDLVRAAAKGVKEFGHE